jgi:hypothetical protein
MEYLLAFIAYVLRGYIVGFNHNGMGQVGVLLRYGQDAY